MVAASGSNYPALPLSRFSFLAVRVAQSCAHGHPSCGCARVDWSVSVTLSSSRLTLQQCFPRAISRQVCPLQGNSIPACPHPLRARVTPQTSHCSNHPGVLTLALQRPMTATSRSERLSIGSERAWLAGCRLGSIAGGGERAGEGECGTRPQQQDGWGGRGTQVTAL